jgi:sialate O-acetylesterase
VASRNYLKISSISIASVKFVSLIFLILLCFHAGSQISLPKLISSGAVLQRDQSLKLWGYASPGERIKISLAKTIYRAKADANGYWECNLPAHPAGGPHEIVLQGINRIILKDILFGDVWLAAGQSNMVINMERVKEKFPEDIASANYPEIRNFFVKPHFNVKEPQRDFKEEGKWIAADHKTVLQFGAASYFFAREIYSKYKIPIGIINVSAGSASIESWMSEEAAKEFEHILAIIQRNKDTSFIEKKLLEKKENAIERPFTDPGSTDSSKWYEAEYNPTGWFNINVPGFWEDQGLADLNGIVWYRKEIEVPESMCVTDANLYLGRIVDSDHAYVNGQLVGNITYQYPPRRYVVPKGVLKPGKNIIVVKVRNNSGKGGFAPDKPYFLKANKQEIDLKGTWQYRVGAAFEPAKKHIPSFLFEEQPTALYNAVMAPVIAQTKVKGVLFYQGETNSNNPEYYKEYLKAFITDLRKGFRNVELPVFVVQLPNFGDRKFFPSESNWTKLRHEQFLATKEMNNTALIVTHDLGEWNDLHPLNKKDIGIRLSKAARNIAYKETDLNYSGPQFKSYEIAGDKMILSFDFLGEGLRTKDGRSPAYFSIAGEDKKYHWAEARIIGDKIELSSPNISNPQMVRYAWADNPVEANLTNETGIPASGFEAGLSYDDKLWKNKKAAVVLTYDDALHSHLDLVIPKLDSAGIKGTFYVPVDYLVKQDRIADWKNAAANGHELGNHTIYHPCNASGPGREWVEKGNDLSKYSTLQMVREIRTANDFLYLLDNRTERTFAFTCGDMSTAEGSFVDSIKTDFVAMRGVQGRLNHLKDFDRNNVNAINVDNNSAGKLIEWVEKAISENAMVVFLFHGVGGDHGLNIDLDKHNAFIDYLESRKGELWITTMEEAAKNIKKVK